MGSLKPSLLTAYLDGELSPARGQLVEQALKSHPDLRRELEQLRQISALLASLPKMSLPEAERRRLAEIDPSLPPLEANEEEIYRLVVAHAYGELEAAEVKRLQELLESEPRWKDELDRHRRIRRRLGELTGRVLSDDEWRKLLASMQQRLERSTVRRRKPLGEYLSGYLDGELSERRRAMIEDRLEQKESARRQLEDLRRVSQSLTQLVRLSAPESLVQKTLAQLESAQPADVRPSSTTPEITVWVDDEAVSARPRRRRNWTALAVAAGSVALTLGLGIYVGLQPVARDRERPSQQLAERDPSPRRPPANVIVAEGIEQIESLLAAAPATFPAVVRDRQIRLTASDLDQLLERVEQSLEPMVPSIEFHQRAGDGSHFIEVRGSAAEIRRVVAKIDGLCRQNGLVASVDVQPANSKLLAKFDEPQGFVAPPASRGLGVDIVGSVRQGLRALEIEPGSAKPVADPGTVIDELGATAIAQVEPIRILLRIEAAG